MNNLKLPVDFSEKAKLPAQANGAGYPYRISASDLMKNFEYAALDADESWMEHGSGTYNSQTRKLKLPALLDDGKFFLVCVDGVPQWMRDTSTFLATSVDGFIKVTAGSYHILNTNTDVTKTSRKAGKYVYARIEHSNAGIFEKFTIEIEAATKPPTELDATGKFVEFSNILLAEEMMDTSVTPPVPKMVQRRVGNLALVHQVVSGRICLWAYSSGGTSFL
jgi:hypothetical protein